MANLINPVIEVEPETNTSRHSLIHASPDGRSKAAEEMAASFAKEAELLAAAGRDSEALLLLQAEAELRFQLQQMLELISNLKSQARIQSQLKDFDAARRLFGDIVHLQLLANDQAGLVRGLDDLARFEFSHGDPQSALQIYADEEAIARSMNWPAAVYSSIIGLGCVRCRSQEYGLALKLFQEAEQVARAMDKPDELGQSLRNQAVVHRSCHRFDQALNALRAQEPTCRDPQVLLRCLLDQATCFQATTDLESALAIFGRAEELSRQHEFVDGLQVSLDGQITIHLARREFKRAAQRSEGLIELCQKNSQPPGLKRGIYTLSVAHRGLEKVEHSMVALLRLESLCSQSSPDALSVACFMEQAMLLAFWNQFQSALPRIDRAVNDATRLGLHDRIVQCLGLKAWIQSNLDANDAVRTTYEYQYALCAERHHEEGQQLAAGHCARSHHFICEFDAAARLYVEQEAIARKRGDSTGIVTALVGRADVHFANCDLSQAEALYSEAAELCRETHLDESLVVVMNGLIRVWLCVEKHEQILEMATEEEELRKRLTARLQDDGEDIVQRRFVLTDHVQRAMGNLALIVKAQGRSFDALGTLVEQCELCRDALLTWGVAGSLANQAALHVEIADFAESLNCLQELQSIYRRQGYEWGLAYSIGEEAWIQHQLGNSRKSADLFEVSVTMLRRLGVIIDLTCVLTNQARFLADCDNTDGARKCASEALELAKAHEWRCRAEYLEQFLETI